jgi:hypothetical protein
VGRDVGNGTGTTVGIGVGEEMNLISSKAASLLDPIGFTWVCVEETYVIYILCVYIVMMR